jgi:hypothetical protein
MHMTDYQFDERLKRLETMMERVVARVLGEEMPRLPKIEEPFKAEPFQPYDPTAAMGMPASVMAAMTAVDCGNPMDAARALSADRDMVKQGPSKDPSQQRAVGQRGWVEPRDPPHFGQSAADRMVDEAVGGAGRGAK